MTKLLYILPEYRENAHTHFSYIPPFLSKVGESLDIALLIERGEKPDIKNISYVSICPNIPILRQIILSAHIISARMRGYKTVYVHYSFMSAFVASVVMRTTGGKVFYWNCGLPWKYTRPFLRDIFERLVYKFVTHVVTGTPKLAERYAEEYLLSKKKVLVMPNWIDIEETRRTAGHDDKSQVRTALGLPKDTSIVLFAHRLSERKGAQYLPDIALMLPKDVTLIVIGDGPLKETIEKQFAELGVEGRVQMYGWQSHRTVLKFMAVSDVFLMPSDEEGFPHVLLESMVLGLPFVATAVGGVPEIVSPKVPNFLVAPHDVKGVRDTIELQLVLPDSLRKVWLKETLDWVKQYDIGRIAQLFISMVRS